MVAFDSKFSTLKGAVRPGTTGVRADCLESLTLEHPHNSQSILLTQRLANQDPQRESENLRILNNIRRDDVIHLTEIVAR